MSNSNNESKIILALQALQNTPKLSLRHTAKVYNVPFTTLRNRKRGKQPRCDIMANSRKLSDLEEQTIV